MPHLFYHNVGLAGSSDFDKTVFRDIEIATICDVLDPTLRADVEPQLERLFPDGACNVWGVPKGAVRVIAQLAPDDIVLLIRTAGAGGDMPALCQVKLFISTPLYRLSEVLWGPDRFPFVFFFRTERISLLWSDFKEHMGYLPNYRPQGLFYSVAEERLWRWGSAQAYATFVREHYQPLALSSMRLGMPQVERRASRASARKQEPVVALPAAEAWVGPELDDPTDYVPKRDSISSTRFPGDQVPGRYRAALLMEVADEERTA